MRYGVCVSDMDSKVTLWKFLLELLVSNKYANIIQWTSEDGEFEFINGEEVAQMWGQHNNRYNMDYVKLSRGLRHYYNKDIIKKVEGKDFVYKFVNYPEVLKTEGKLPVY